ncbi:MAG: PQQ-binding-like beta-propeller repeat protein [Phycisphaerales bacterium]
MREARGSTRAHGGGWPGSGSNAPSLAAGVLAAAGAFSASGQPCPLPLDGWLGPAGGGGRASLVERPLPACGQPTWNRTRDETGATIRFANSVGVAVSGSGNGALVFALGRVSRPGGPSNEPRVFAFARDSGEPVWSRPISSPSLDSWSGPVLDTCNGTVIVCSGRMVAAFDQLSGEPRWQRLLTRVIVNASPVVTSDLGPGDRLFVTDFNGGGTSGRLYCINVDPFDAANNPFQPGEIVWSRVIGGTSGNSPAYDAGVVYVATNGRFFTPPTPSEPGSILAFSAGATSEPEPLWTFANVLDLGFYGGVCVNRDASGTPMVYAASYNFSLTGPLASSNLVKVNGACGDLVWSAPCGRTSTIPVPLPGGRVLLSEGVRGEFGSAAALALYEDLGSSAQPLWNTAVASWVDVNGNLAIDEGEYKPMGGWTMQPVVSQFGGVSRAVVGALPGSAGEQTEELLVVDLGKGPLDPEFLVEDGHGPGNPAALAGTTLYSTGEHGLHAFGATTLELDLNGDGYLTVDDLYAWEQGLGGSDVNGDGVTDAEDRAWVASAVRAPGVPKSEGL